MQIKEAIRMLYGLALGSLVYVPLVLVPIIGPLFAGISAGKIAKMRPQQGFLLGVASAAIGFLLWVFLVFPFFNLRPDTILSEIFWMLFILWNLFCILLAGIGGLLGSMLSLSDRMFFSHKGTNDKISRETVEENANGSNAPVYVICPACATSNAEDAVRCINCGKEIR